MPGLLAMLVTWLAELLDSMAGCICWLAGGLARLLGLLEPLGAL